LKAQCEDTMKREASSSQASRRLGVILLALSLAVLSLFTPQAARAQKMIYAQSVQAEEVIDNDIFLRGDEPVIDGVVNGDAFIVGSNVSITGQVNGSVFILANKVDIEGGTSGNVFVLAVTTREKAGASIGRSLYTLGMSLITDPDAEILRDLHAVAISASLQGKIGRDTQALIGLIEILRLLGNGLNRSITGLPDMNQPLLAMIPAQNLQPGSSQMVHSLSGMSIMGSGISGVIVKSGSQEEVQQDSQQAANQTAELRRWLISRLLSLVSLLIVGVLILWLFPQRLTRWIDSAQSQPLASAGYGLLALVNGFLLPFLLIALIIGVTVGLLYLYLPSIAWLFFGTGFGSLVMGFSFYLLVVIYISKVIVALLVGSLILTRLSRSAEAPNPWLALLVGLVLYTLLGSLPYLGFAVGLLTTILGLGAIWVTYRTDRSPIMPVSVN